MNTPVLDNTRHLRYWQRCLRSLLPHQYTGNDSTRMTLGCFTVAAIDLLSPASGPEGPAPTWIPLADRRRLREWVLSCQHPGGGFAGGPTHVPLQASDYDGFDFDTGRPAVGTRDAANLAATLFALQLLALLSRGDEGEDKSAFCGVHRTATLDWLRTLQRKDGSFGEVLVDVVECVPSDKTGQTRQRRRTLIAGGADTRYCYMAAMIRWILRGDVQPGTDAWVEDIDVDALVRYIRQGQTYDGGFSESSTHESHGGYAFCAVAALSLLGRPPDSAEMGSASSTDTLLGRGIPNRPLFLHWLAQRKLQCYPAGSDSEAEDDDLAAEEEHPLGQTDNLTYIGFNGRCNKPADTCYTWWVMGTTANLTGSTTLSDQQLIGPSRRFLLDEMQHVIGGFSKTPGGPPDLYHSYLGLAALATMGEPRLQPLDPAFCISVEAVRRIQVARRSLLRGAGQPGRDRRRAFLDLGSACWA